MSVVLEHSPRVKCLYETTFETRVPLFDVVVCVNSQFDYSCEKQCFISPFTADPSGWEGGWVGI